MDTRPHLGFHSKLCYIIASIVQVKGDDVICKCMSETRSFVITGDGGTVQLCTHQHDVSHFFETIRYHDSKSNSSFFFENRKYSQHIAKSESEWR